VGEAKALEKDAVTKRQADMVAALAREEKKKKKEQRNRIWYGA